MKHLKQITLFIGLFLWTTIGLQAQIGCNTISYNLNPLGPCHYRLFVNNQASDCYHQINVLIQDGAFTGWTANANGDWIAQQISPTEIQLTNSLGFIPSGNNWAFDFNFFVSGQSSTTLTMLADNTCVLEGCAANLPLEACSGGCIAGIVYQECTPSPYSNQATLPNWTVYLTDVDLNILDSTSTDGDGAYSFCDLSPGNYWVKERVQQGWTPTFPASGQSPVTLAAAQNATRNFGNCLNCSCDDMHFTVQPVSHNPDTCCYDLTLQNTGANCFDHIKIEVDPGQYLNNWTFNLPGWTLTQIAPEIIVLNPPANYVPVGTTTPFTFCVAGGAYQNISISTSFTTSNASYLCENHFAFVCPPPDDPCVCPNNGVPGPSLVDNGDFSGNGGFSTAYSPYAVGAALLEGQYWIGSNPHTVNSGFQSCTDHTSGSGNMMVVNGATSGNATVWCETINVTPNTTYLFETWVASLSSASPAHLQLYIDNVAVGGGFQASATTCEWNPYCESWFSGTNTSVTICIVDQNGTATGNDFALDDISFRKCTPTGEIIVTKYFDLDCDGLRDVDPAGNIIDTGLPGWSFAISGPNSYSATGTTNAQGQLVFGNLPSGIYSISETQQYGWFPSNPANGTSTVVLVAPGTVYADFGNCLFPCDSLTVSATPLVPPSDSCCWNVSFGVHAGPILSVQAEILTGGITFNAPVLNASGLTMIQSAPNLLNIEVGVPHQSIPLGNYLNALHFCFAGVTNAAQIPQVVVFRWFRGPNALDTGDLMCTDTMYFNCVPNNNACTCQQGAGIHLNYDGFSQAVGCGQGPFSPVFPAPQGQVVVTGNFGCVDLTGNPCGSTIDWTLYGPNGQVAQGAIIQGTPLQIYFPQSLFNPCGGYSLRMTTLCPGQMDSCICISRWIFECDSVCTCGTFDMQLTHPSGLIEKIYCDDAIPVENIGTYTLNTSFQCQGNNCPPTAQVDWVLSGPPGFFTQNGTVTATPGFVIPALSPGSFPIPGTYTLNMYGYCGGDTCPCEVKFCAIPPPVVHDTAVCRTLTSAYIPIYGCPSAMCGVTQVRWFVKKCSASTWPSAPYQVSSGPGCSSLLLLPYQYTGESCVEVYAEITLDGSCCGITQLLSNVAVMTLCDPVSCNISNNFGPYCQSGDPGLLQVSFPSTPPCTYTVQWYHDGQPITGATNLTYDPPLLSFPSNLPSSVCYYDHVYSVTLTGPCGPSTCSTFIRIYNDNADVGQIDMIPFEPQPFCPGEDATLVYTEACAGEPGQPMWTWNYSTVSGSGPYTPIPNFGMMDAVINTNKLYQTTWYMVEKQNGVCPADQIKFKIEVKNALTITNFTATPDPCADMQVALSVSFTPSPIAGANCTYIIDWYKDGVLIHTSSSNTSSVSYTYLSPNPGTTSVAGVYYAVVRDNCCPQSVTAGPVVIDPTCVPVITGPCFRCGNAPVDLEVHMVLPPKDNCPTVGSCTYQWYVLDLLPEPDVWVAVSGATNATYSPNAAGHYMVESNCNGCIRRDDITVAQCTSTGTGCVFVSAPGVTVPEGTKVLLFPNPAVSQVTVQISPAPIKEATLQIVDVTGKILHTERIPAQQEKSTIDLNLLPTGIYFVRVYEGDMLLWIDKIVKAN